MALAGVYGISFVVFLAIDFVGLKFLLYPLFARHIGELLRPDPLMGVAAGFYALYVAGVLYFAVLPAHRAESVGLALLNGALLGLIAYGTYEMTNMATLKGWAWPMVITDMAWGAALTAATAVVGYFAARALL